MTCKITLRIENLFIWMEKRSYYYLLSASWADPTHLLESSRVFRRRWDYVPPYLRCLRIGSSAISCCVVLQTWIQLVFLTLFRCSDVEPQTFDSCHLSASMLYFSTAVFRPHLSYSLLDCSHNHHRYVLYSHSILIVGRPCRSMVIS